MIQHAEIKLLADQRSDLPYESGHLVYGVAGGEIFSRIGADDLLTR